MSDLTVQDLDKDQAFAILGDDHDAYFDVPCECCGGDGSIQPEPLNPRSERKCPSCEGSGEKSMPDDDLIRRAVHLITEGVDYA